MLARGPQAGIAPRGLGDTTQSPAGGAALAPGTYLCLHIAAVPSPNPGELTVTGLSPVQLSSSLALGGQELSSWHLPEPAQAEQSGVKTMSVHKEGVLHGSLHFS